MKKSITKTMLLVMIAMVSILMVAQIAKAGIITTKHNLSLASNGIDNSGGQNNEICVYCHTPHMANTAAGPLWNKAAATGNYTMYGNTLAGTAPDSTPNTVTKACLSCHDGVSAINSVVNQAGSGGYLAAGTKVAWANPVTSLDTALLMPDGVTRIGEALGNDHPVSIVYTTAKASLRAPNGTASATAKVLSATEIKGVSEASKVECSSCHDPHAASGDSVDGGGTAGALFLRVSNTGSALCLACHVK